VAASGFELKRQRHRVADAEQIVSVSRHFRSSLPPSLIDIAGPQTSTLTASGEGFTSQVALAVVLD
jgi:hypothetical protein